MPRLRLPNHRPAETFGFEVNGLEHTATISRFSGGELAEIFLENGKVGSGSDTEAKDSAVVCSIALQYGIPVDVIRKALMRDARGNASSPPGVARDLLAEAAEAKN